MLVQLDGAAVVSLALTAMQLDGEADAVRGSRARLLAALAAEREVRRRRSRAQVMVRPDVVHLGDGLRGTHHLCWCCSGGGVA